MHLDGRTLTLHNVPRWREQLDVSEASTVAALQTAVAALQTAVAALETAVTDLQASLAIALLAIEALESDLDALAARVTALEAAMPAADTTMPSWDVIPVDGVDLLDYAERPMRDWQNLVIESPETGKLYRVQPIKDDAGNTNFELVEADTLRASDGRRWRVVIQFVDGVPNIADLELIP